MNEERSQWRPLFAAIFLPLVKAAPSISAAALTLNKEIWRLFNIHYEPNQTPAIMSPPQVSNLQIFVQLKWL